MGYASRPVPRLAQTWLLVGPFLTLFVCLNRRGRTSSSRGSVEKEALPASTAKLGVSLVPPFASTGDNFSAPHPPYTGYLTPIHREVWPVLFEAAEAYEQRPYPYGSEPKRSSREARKTAGTTPCWLESSGTAGDSASEEIHCMPSFYLLGVPKCGTSSVYDSLTQHPLVAKSSPKETHFWRDMANSGLRDEAEARAHRRRLTRRFGENFEQAVAALEKAARSDASAASTASSAAGDAGGGGRRRAARPASAGQQGGALLAGSSAAWQHIALGEFSPETFLRWNAGGRWDSAAPDAAAMAIIDQSRGHLPPVMRDLAWTTPELLRSFQPGARLAVVLRDPAVRAASQYMNDCFAACQEPALAEEKLLGFEFCRCPVTPDSFAQIIDEALPVAERCIARLGATQCALIFVSGIGGSQEDTVGPNSTLHPRALQWFFEGLYAVPIRVWTQLYPKEQLLVLTMEQLLEDTRRQILRLFEHIGVGDVSEDVWEGIIRESFGTRVRTDFGKKVITADTHRRLHAFYRGYNSELAELLGEPHFASIWMPPH